MTFKPYNAGIRRGPAPAYDFGDDVDFLGGGLSDTHRALTTMFAPMPDPMYFPGPTGFNGTTNPGFRTGASRLASTAQGRGYTPVGVQAGEEEEVTPVPGPLGMWEDDKGRPHQQIGKFGANLLGTAGPGQPGAPTPYTPEPVEAADKLRGLAAPDNPENSGFWQGLLGGIGQMFGETGRGVGSFIGSGIDLPFEAVGNVAGLPGSAVSSAQYLVNRGEQQGFNPLGLLSHIVDPTGGLDLYLNGAFEPGAMDVDDDLAAIYREAAADNPINGLLLMGQLAKAQWQRDVEQGRRTGLMQDIGPATAVTDQLGVLLAALTIPQRAVVRGATNLLVSTEREAGPIGSIKSVEEAVRRDDLASIKSEAWQRIAQRLQRGDFGPVGSQQARDGMLDTIQSEGSLLRDVNDAEQHPGFENQEGLGFLNGVLPFNWTFQGLADMAFSIATDPLIIADFGVAGISRGAKAATMAANTRVWAAIPAARRAAVEEAVEEVGMRVGNFADKERVWDAIGRSQKMPETPIAGSTAVRDGGFEMRVMKEVLDRPEFSDIAGAARKEVDFVTNFRMNHEPAMRGIKSVVNTVNDPFRLFGIGTGDRALGSVFDAHTTEGVIRGAGTLDAHVELQKMLGEVPGDFRANYDRGLGVHTANFARTYFRNGLVKDLRRRARNGDLAVIPFEKEPGIPLSPSEVIEAKMGGARGIDIATGVEQQALRVRPLYLATEKGGAEQALVRAREQAAHRLQLMGMDEATAVKLSGRMSRDHASLLDASYFGFATEGFTKARAKAMTRAVKKGGLDPEALTILGPRQLTVQKAEDILAAISRGDGVDAVREALGTYDILFDNLSHQMDEDKLVQQVKMLLTDQIEGKALPRDLDSLDGLSKELRSWADDNAELGYRPGFRPTPENGDHWRATVDRTGDEPKIIGINPWVELVGTSADVPTYNRWQRARSMLFHNIRGERIMADARVRMAEFVAEEWGGTKADADALFARFISASTEAGVTPRAMSPKQIYQIVASQKMTVPVQKVGMNNAVEVLMYAFEGNWRHVGLSQKFTGAAKTTLGGQSNWIGQMAERVYPLTRFTLNPLFQVQELIEPFIMNTARGIKPGFKPTDLDTKTIALVESMIRDGIYSFDDQIERTAILLWGANAAKEAYRPAGKLGKLVHLMSLNGRINVQSVKQVNYARATRRQLGKEFESAMERVAPDLHAKLPRHYATSDWGEIGVRYLTEKGQLETPMHVLKPDHLGQRAPVELDKVIAHFDDIETSAELRAAVTRGDLTRTDFHDTLIAAGADPDFVIRAYDTAAAGFSADEWFEGWRTNFAAGNQRQTNEAKAMVKSLAQVQGMSSEEWLTKYMSGVPQSVDEAAIAALTPAEKRHVKLMTDLAAMDQGISAELDDALSEFRRDKRFADREHFAAIADDGTVLFRGHQPTPWRIASSGMPSEAGLGDEIADGLPLVEGNWMVHNHPSYSPFSPADIVTGVEFNAKGSVVESPGITYALTPDPDEGWLTEAFLREHGERPVSMHPKVQEAYFRGIRQRVHEEWISKGQEVIANLQQHPFYADATGEQWDGYLEAIGGQVAVKRLADRYGWTFKSTEHALLPADPAIRHELVRDFLQNPPPGLRSRNPLAFSSQPGLRLDAKAGAAMPLSISQRNRPWLPEALANNPTVRAGWENWARARLAPKFGTAITDVAHGADNTMWDAWGTGEQIEDLSAAVGFLLRQDEVVSTKVKPGAVIARPANGERWSLNFIGEDPDAVIAQVNEVLPDVARWGRPSVVKTADGRTAVRFVRADQTSDITRFQFNMDVADYRERDFPVSIEIRPEVVDFRRVSTDWETQGAEGYLGGLRTRRPDVVGELEHGLAEESEAQLAHLARLADPAAYDAHAARLTAAGESIPDFPIPGEYRPVPVADRLTITLPGGRDSFFDGERRLTLWEQQGIKAQHINAINLYNADPDLYVNLMKSIWRSKERTLDSDVERQAFNMFAFGALTGGAALDTTEGAFALLRAQTGSGVRRGIRGQKVRAQRIIAKLPERFRGNPSHVGIAFQLDEGLRLPSIQSGRAGWLSPGQRTDIDNLTINVNSRLRLATDADRDAMAKRIQTEMDDMGYGNLMTVHPFPINYADTAEGGAGFLAMPGDFVSLPRPNMRMKGINTNRTWGRVLQWLDSGLFDSDIPEVQRFLRIQPGESRAAYGLRMSSILPGIDTKTAMMSMSSAGPSMLAHGAMDTHGVRYTAQSALKRGELGRYYQDIAGVEFLPTSDHTVFEAATKKNTRKWNLSPHLPEEFANNKVFLSEGGDTGFMVTPEGDLQNVFSNPGAPRGAGRAAVERAVAEGATHLDAYDGFLPGYYAQHGFRETGRVRFVDEYAPEGYDIATQGRPDIVFMARTGATDNVPGTNYFDDWDEAKAHSRTMVPEQAGGLPPAPGTTPLPPGKIRAYHYTSNLDAVEKEGLDVAYAKGDTYGEPNRIWFSASKPNDDTSSYVEVFLDADEIDTVGTPDQSDLDFMMKRGSNFTVRTDKIGPERFVSVSRPRNYRLTYMVENYPPGSAKAAEWIKTDADFVRGLDDDYRWAMDEYVRMHEAAAGGPQAGLLDRLTPSYAAKLRKALQSGGDAFPAPSSKRVYLVPSGMRKKPWSPAKLQAMRDNLHLIPDPEMKALYDNDEVLRYVSETDGKVNIWEGGDYAVMEDYFNTTLRADEVRKLREAGHNEAADAVEAMTGAEWQWFKWDHIRSGKGTPLDPHVGVTVGADTVQPRTGGELDRAIRVNRLGSPFDPHMGALFQQMDGKIMGAAQFDKDGRAMLLATQHADSRTGMHELAHVIEGTLDPSLRNKVMAQFREATGSTRQQWNRDVSEWWADEFLRYIRGGSLRGMDPTLRSSFEYFRKTVGGVEATIKAQAAERAATAGRASAIKRATKAIERTTAPARETEKAASQAMRELESRNRELRKARGRAGIDTLESKARAQQDEVALADQNLRDAKADVRVATQEVKQARVRAKEALGSRSAGGAATGVNRKIAAQRLAEAKVGAAEAALTKARKRSVEANRKLAGAKRRTPLGDYVKARDQAKTKADKLSSKAAVSKKAHADARSALDEAKRMPTKPPKTKVPAPVISDAMQGVFDDILRPKVEPDTKWGPGSPIDASAHYDLQEEAAYQAAQLALSRAEENAFTLHYYKRGRSMVERSINHPYLGLYPASYMWGKVLPELLRFLLVSPFGLDAPLGGLLLANNIYRQTLMQQQYNEDFRKNMLGNTDAFHMLSLLLPASPWEVPVNAPLWMRRISENGLTYEDKLRDLKNKYGDNPIPDDEMPPLMDMASHGRTVRDMLSYAFVPAVEQITGGAGTIFGAADTTLRDAAQGVEGILKAGNAPPPVQPAAEVVAPLPDRTTLPSAEQGYQP